MKSLNKYLDIENKKIWDGHIHLFDHSGFINKSLIKTKQKCVCFADIAFRYIDKYKKGEMISYYDNFIQNHLDPSKHILLATGISSEEIISIYKKYPQYIKGFGELKCYSKWQGGRLPYGNLKWVEPLMEFNRGLKLPVYIHFNLDTKSHREKFQAFVNNYKEIPIVLCHCGMVDDREMNDHIFTFVKQLMSMYDNLYVDLSTFKTRDYFLSNPNKIFQLNTNNVIIGTDINPIAIDAIKNHEEFSENCYKQLYQLSNYCNHENTIDKLFNITNDKEDELIKLYQTNFNSFTRHCQIHLLTRGNLIGIFSQKLLRKYLKHNAKILNNVIDLFNYNIDQLLNDYVLIGYKEDDRKRKIGELFRSVDDDYKKFLCLITILEMTYTFQRTNLSKLINMNSISSLINENINLLHTCIVDDKYNFKEKAATKYINSIYFIKNLQDNISSLQSVLPENIEKSIIEYYIKLYNENPNTTTLYGITHILIGASGFYTKKISDIYNPLINILYNSITNTNVLDNITLDLQMEILLCCKLFGKPINIDLSDKIKTNKLEENEHTNMLYILLKKYKIQ